MVVSRLIKSYQPAGLSYGHRTFRELRNAVLLNMQTGLIYALMNT